MKSLTKLFLPLLLLLSMGLSAQVGSFSFSTNTTATLEDMTGSTDIFATGTYRDDVASTLQTMPGGFVFPFEGTNYTQFSVNSNGQIQLGATVISGTAASPGAGLARIAPISGDNAIQLAGKVHSKLVAGSPSYLVIEFNNLRIPFSSTVGTGSTCQALLYDNGNIEFRYGAMFNNSTATASRGVYFSSSNVVGTVANVVTINTTPAFNGTGTGVVTTTFALNSAMLNLNGTTPGAQRSFLFVPPVPCSGTPTAGTTTPALQNVCQGTTPAALSLVGTTSGVSGLTFQWQESPDGVNFSNVTTGTGGTTAVYTPDAFAGAPIYYRCAVTCTPSASTDFSVAALVNRPDAPTTQASAAVGVMANTGATITWTAGNGGRRLVILNTVNSFTDPVSGTTGPAAANTTYGGVGEQVIYDGTGTSVTVSGLNCASTYYVRVYEYRLCTVPANEWFFNTTTATDNPSAGFTTTVYAVPQAVNFTGFTGANLSTLFPGWGEAATVAATGSTSLWTSQTGVGGAGNITARLNLYTTSRREWIVSPQITLTTNNRITFDAAVTVWNSITAPSAMGSDDSVRVMISTDCGASWTQLLAITAANAPTNVLSTYEVNLAAYNGQTVKLAIYASDGPVDDAPDYDFHLDNITVEETPACPSPNGFIASNITNNAATISWNATTPPPANGYRYRVVLPGQSPDVAPYIANILVANTVLSANITGLTGSTTYDAYVRSQCPAAGPWEGPLTFTTACDPVTLVTENFDGVTVPALPACWSTFGGTLATTETSGFNSAPNAVYLYSGSAATPSYLVLPPLSNVTAGTHRLKFSLRGNFSAGGIVSVGYMTDPANGATFVSLGNYTAASNTVYQNVLVTPVGVPNGVTTLAIRHNGNGLSVKIDDVAWETLPPCPEPAGLAAATVCPAAVALSWTAAGSTTNFDVFQSTVNVAPTQDSTATYANISGTTFTTPALADGINYYFWVRANCGAIDTSEWVGPVVINVPLAIAAPYSEGFEVAPVPGWIILNGSWFVATAHGQTGNGLYMNFYNTANNLVGNLRTPIIENVGAGYLLEFNSRVLNFSGFPTGGFPTGNFGKISIDVSTDCGATYAVLVDSVPVTGTWAPFSTSLAAYAGQDIMARIRGQWVSGDWYFDMDNFSVYAVCAGAPTAGTSSTTTPEVCAGSTFTVSLAGQTVAAGIGIQWEESTDNTIFTPVAGATGTVLSRTLTQTSYYRAVVSCSYSASSATSSTTTVTLSSDDCLCACASNATNTADTKLDSVIIGGNAFGTPGTTCETLTKYCDSGVTFAVGDTVPLHIVNGSCSGIHYGAYASVYADWNGNGSFADAGDTLYYSPVTTGLNTIPDTSFIVPAGANSSVLLRVILQEGTAPAAACGTYAYGETEDFELTIQDLTLFYADSDGDGFGNPAVDSLAVTQPVGYVVDNTDCNDADAAVYPGAVEVCFNAIDNDCDGLVDEGCPVPCATGATGMQAFIQSLSEVYAVWEGGDPYQNTIQLSYRLKNSTTWTTRTTTVDAELPNNSLAIRPVGGFLPDTIYDVRVRFRCANLAFTPYSDTAQFSTYLLNNPTDCRPTSKVGFTYLKENGQWLGNKVLVLTDKRGGGSATAKPYFVSWKPASSPTWLSRTQAFPKYNVISLTPNTLYDYRWRTWCDATNRWTAFVNGQFTTLPAPPAPLNGNSASRNELDETVAMGSVFVFPNPADDFVNIFFENGESLPVLVRVFDTQGRQVASMTPASDLERLDISTFAPGTYMIQVIQTDQRVVTEKFVKF